MSTSNMSGGSCAATRSTSWLASPGVRATTRTLLPKPPMLLASISPHPQWPFSLHADQRVLAQSGRGVVLDLAGAVAQQRLLHKSQTTPGAHRRLHQRI